MSPTESALTAELVSAYLSTEYRVLSPRQFTLRIGVASDELKSVYADYQVASAAYLTAWNPLGREASRIDNDRSQAALAHKLALGGYSAWSGLGIDPSSDWPGEESLLVLGLDLEKANSIGGELRQNAIVWAGSDAVPQLVLLR